MFVCFPAPQDFLLAPARGEEEISPTAFTAASRHRQVGPESHNLRDLGPSATPRASQALAASLCVADGRRVALGAHAKDQRLQRVYLRASKA